MATLFCIFLQLLIPFAACPSHRIFESAPEEVASSPTLTAACLVNGSSPETVGTSFQAARLALQLSSRNHSPLARNSNGTYNITAIVNVSSKNCTDGPGLTRVFAQSIEIILSNMDRAVSSINRTVVPSAMEPLLTSLTAAMEAQTAAILLAPLLQPCQTCQTTHDRSQIVYKADKNSNTSKIFSDIKLNFPESENRPKKRTEVNQESQTTNQEQTCDQVEIETELELVELTLQGANDQMSERMLIVIDGMNTADSFSQEEILQRQLDLLQMAGNVEVALQVVEPAAAIASFIFAIILPSELDLITELVSLRFNQINRKLDKLLNSLTLMETNIKTSIAFNTFLSTYIEWEYAIRNGAEKLRTIRERIGQTQDKRKQRNLALDYITYYNDNQLEGRMLNVYRITVTANNPTNRNLFDLLAEQHSCDVKQLSGLMIILKGLMTSAAQQTLTYYYFKGENARAKGSYEIVKKYLFKMRQEFQKRVYSCKKNTIRNGKKEVEKILEKNVLPYSEVLVQLISQRLTHLYPWYAWGVAEFKKIGESSCISGLGRQGSNYLTITNIGKQKRNILVTWQDINDHLSCIDLSLAKTRVPYLRCDQCNDNHVSASQNILIKKRCPHTLNLQCIKDNLTATVSLHWDWVAVDVEARKDMCGQPQVCNGHGQCYPVPDTNQFMCICHAMYAGETCEREIVFNNVILKHLATLRTEFMAVNGIPSVVDIYFELQNGLKTGLKNINDAITHTQTLVKHSEILYKASYILHLFIDLRQGRKNFDTFGKLLENFLQFNSENYILFRLRGILLGEGIADLKGEDFFNTFKRNYVSKYNNACTQAYSTAVNNLKTNLAYLDEAVGEALLTYKKWGIEKGNKIAITSLETFTQDFSTRQRNFHNYWKKTSCPSLIAPGLIENYCSEKLSYENMKVQLSCSDHKVPSPSSVQCVRKDGKLVWSAIPKCNYQWAMWGSWSSCSVTCGIGIQNRTRGCVNHGTSYCGSMSRQEKTCINKKCCLSKDGNYRCSNGRCIHQSQLCDGNNDCWNGDDEFGPKCPEIIQSGDTIALKASCTENHWLSCQCQYCPIWLFEIPWGFYRFPGLTLGARRLGQFVIDPVTLEKERLVSASRCEAFRSR
ncbi:SE-cephalotoxin-like [Heptranchias perlo]|uniref:SE-cephalotoxin-like n=1 Tax=Heptranchias perlo TaxID=212740 RepID=UPI00355A7E1F